MTCKLQGGQLASSITQIFDNEVGKLLIEENNNMLFLHYTSKQWNVGVYKKLYRFLLFLCNELKKEGHNFLYTAIPNDDYKLAKFQMMFGFVVKEEYNDFTLYVRSL